MDESSYDEYDRRSMPPSELLERLLEIKKDVGDEIFKDALALLQAQSTPPPHHHGEACRERAGNGRTRLPHNFICKYHHRHPVSHLADLLDRRQPRCLLERILLEWASLPEVGNA